MLKRMLLTAVFAWGALAIFGGTSFADAQPNGKVPTLMDNAGKAANGNVNKEQPRPEPSKYTGVRYPIFSPDGKKIAFSLYGDIWIIPAGGGLARRLTLHEAMDTRPIWSPDGKQIAFSSFRNGNWDVFVTDEDGSAPRQITFHSADDYGTDWSMDGKALLVTSTRLGKSTPWLVPVNGGVVRQLTSESADDVTFSPDGKRVVYNWGYIDRDVLDYSGSANWDIWIMTPGETPKKMTDFNGQDIYPLWSSDGKSVYFVREANNAFNFWRLPSDGGKAEQVSDFKDGMIRNPRLSRDGNKLVFERDFELWTYSLNDKKSGKVKFEIKTDNAGNETYRRTYSEGASSPSQSPDGREVVFSMSGDLWAMPSSGGYARRISSGKGNDAEPRWSPDGKWITFYSDRSGNNEIWIIRPDGADARQLTDHAQNDFFPSWAPDSKAIVFCSERSGNRDIWRQGLDGSPAVQLTNTTFVEDDPILSPDGKWLYFDSDRGGKLEIWRMPANGGEPERIAGANSQIQSPLISPDGKFLIFSQVEGGFWLTYANGGPAMQLSVAGRTPAWSFDGKNILYEAGSHIATLPAPTEILAPKIIPFVATVEINRKAEMLQVFDEAWTILKNGFYDPNFHGADWNKIREKYRPLVANAQVKDEMYKLISQMLGELKASHLGIMGPPQPNKAYTGVIGARLEPADNQKEGLVVIEVVPNTPADKAWLRQGDLVLAIDGKKLSANEDYEQLLNGKPYQKVRFEIAPAGDFSKKRAVEITPVNLDNYNGILYQNWIQRNAAQVNEKSGGQVGYVHIRSMLGPDLEIFKQRIQQLQDKKALVLDVRNNGGGNTHEAVLDILRRKAHSLMRPRGEAPKATPDLAWGKPVVLLINQNSHSDAEIFPFAFKEHHLGKVVGVPTSGSVIGTHFIQLCDGSGFRVPDIGWFTRGGENLEKLGIKPDIIVGESAEDRLNQRDPQLLKALEIIMQDAQIVAAPAPPQKGPEKKDAPEKQSPSGPQPNVNKSVDVKKNDAPKPPPVPSPKKEAGDKASKPKTNVAPRSKPEQPKVKGTAVTPKPKSNFQHKS